MSSSKNASMVIVDYLRQSAIAARANANVGNTEGNVDSIRIAVIAYIEFVLETIPNEGDELDAVSFWHNCISVADQSLI